MATVLHLIGANDTRRALPVIAGQVAAGDEVTIALVGPSDTALPPDVTVHRVPDSLSWEQLLELIFSTDQTFSW